MVCGLWVTGAPCDNGNNNKNPQCSDYVTNLGSCYYYYYTVSRSSSFALSLSLLLSRSLAASAAVASSKFVLFLWKYCARATHCATQQLFLALSISLLLSLWGSWPHEFR